MTLRNTILLLLPSAMLAQQAVETVRAVSRPVERILRLPGELVPYQNVDLHARVTGFVERVEVDRGSLVREGDQLVVLSAPELAAQRAGAEARLLAVESQRAEAEAKLAAARSTSERLRAASATPGAVSGNELVQAEEGVKAVKALGQSLDNSAKAARASLEALRELEGYLKVKAPFDGVITERWVHPGALVGPASGSAGPMLRLEQHSRLRLVVAVPEADVAGIPKSARVAFSVPAYRDENFHGTVARVSRSIESKTRTMPVELDVQNPGRLSPGMYADVQWPVRKPRPALLVPPSSIVTTTERSFVIRVRGGKAEWVGVSRGALAGDQVEIFGALQAGDEIVRRGSDEIREGTLLKAKP